MANTLDLTSNFPEVLDVLEQVLKRVSDLSEPMASIAAVLESASEQAFSDEADPATGENWTALSDLTLALRPQRQGGMILQDSTSLASSVTTEAGADFAQIGTNVPYATTMFFGANQGAFGKNSRGHPLPWGDIPARPYLGVGDEDKADILDILEAEILSAL